MRRTVPVLLALGLLCVASAKLRAAPITFNTALPVAKGAFISRELGLARRFKGDQSALNRDLDVNGFVSVLGYGVTPKLALFAVAPYLDKHLDLTVGGQRKSRSSRGFGDAKLFARYTFLQRDERSKTLRVAGFAGFKAPTGEDQQRDALGRLPIPLQSGTGAWDGFGGLVLTYQTLPYEIDAQLSLERSGTTNGFELGSVARADASLQYRLLPQQMRSDTRGFLYGVLETNFIHQDNNRLLGMDDANSGGTQVYVTPGIQYVTLKYVLEAAVQLPVVQNMNGSALKTDYIVTAGFRVNF